MVKTKWVKSWRAIPGKDHDSSLAGYHDPNTIYLIKGKSSKAVAKHEEYHSIAKHKNKPRDPRIFARDELEAWQYAYEQIEQPKHLLEHLRAIFNDLVLRTYHITPAKALKILREELYDIDPPETWLKDFEKLKKEYNKIY